MKNPLRRNRNIGTAKQGHGRDNQLLIPSPAAGMKSFYERLGPYQTVDRTIKGHRFRFVVEKTRSTSIHACTIDDIACVIAQLPAEIYGSMALIVLRQPTRKEEMLGPVWGRMVYSYLFENEYLPAIVLEAVDFGKKLKWDKKLSLEAQKELERLRQDGHNIREGKRHFEAEYELENVRSTQLYRTLLHEFGHYVHYLEVVERPGHEEEPAEDREKRSDHYHNLPKTEREAFAHARADQWGKYLTTKGLIPFGRIWDEEAMLKDGIDRSDFFT
jgi:hypothetical protein